jgi:ZIP family zinc transporter
LGAACVFVMRDTLHTKVQRILTGFAAGVMVAASIWSLLVPAWAFLPAVVGFWLSILFLLVLAVTLHNIPEGMAVGVVLAGWMSGNNGITAAGTLALSIGIAIQNFPEGAIVSMPLRAEGVGKGRAFLYCVLSGIVEPLAAILTMLAAGLILPALSYLLSFAAGAYDLCSGGGTAPGGIRRQTLQLGDAVFRSGIYRHAGAGCGAGLKRGNCRLFQWQTEEKC